MDNEIMTWYVNQARFMVQWHEGRLRFLIHDTMIGCYWADTFTSYDEAVEEIYRFKNLRRRFLTLDLSAT